MLFERFRNVVQVILTTETTKISGLRPDSQKFHKGTTFGKNHVPNTINPPPLLEKGGKQGGVYG